MFRKKETRNQYPMYNQPMNHEYMMNPGSVAADFSRIELEINELKRVISDLNKRILKLENYLGVRSDGYSEYGKF